MLLKRMEIFGFKSFAEKVTIDFSPGISAIIGPNGCGKSNIIDALRWVLGEQSVRTLRGGRMEDLIFTGTQKKKPLNMAEVSLLLEGGTAALGIDCAELEITRRMYRSGESEYFINKKTCRLKDIQEVFMDTGIGREVYSIVGQNKVEEIISSRSEERRELIEEAAGILKYKQRKKEALRRLAEMRGNLQRVEDIVLELDNQITPLQGQADIARKYLSLKKQYREKEQALAAYSIKKTLARLQKAVDKLEAVQNEAVALISVINNSSSKLAELRQRREELAEQKSDLEGELTGAAREKEHLEGELRLLKIREEEFERQIDDAQRRKKGLTRRLNDYQQELKDCQLQKENLELHRQKTDEELAACKEKLAAMDKDDTLQRVEELQQEKMEIESGESVTASTLQEFKGQKEAVNLRIQRLQQQSDSIRARKEQNLLKVKELRQKQAQLARELAAEEEKEKEFARELESKQAAAGAVAGELEELKNGLSKDENKLWLLRKLQDEKAGQQEGPGAVIKASRRDNTTLNGIAGQVLERIRVPERYRRALHGALEERKEALITSDEAAALRGIEYLKTEKKGRASFLPATVAKNKKEPADNGFDIEYLKSIAGTGVLGRACDVVEVQDDTDGAVTGLLHSIVVVEDMDTALKAAGGLGYGYTVAALNGDAVTAEGFVRGGGEDGEAAVPWNIAGEIRELETIVAKGQHEVKALAQKRNQAAENIRNMEKEQENNKKKAVPRQKELTTIEKELYSLENQDGYFTDSEEKARETLAEAQTERAELEDRTREAMLRLDEFTGEKERVEMLLDELSDRYNSLTEEREQSRNALTGLQVEGTRLQEQLSGVEHSIIRIGRETKGLQPGIDDAARREKEVEEKITELQEQKEEKEDELLYLAKKGHTVGEEFAALKNLYDCLLAEIKEMEKEETDFRDKQEKLNRQERRLELDKVKLQTERDHLLKAYGEKFNEYIDDYPDIPEKGQFNEEEAAEEMIALREEMNGLGQVRLGVIDEMERLTTRRDFLNEQKEDLLNSEVTLEKILKGIDEEIGDRFLKAFGEITAGFDEVFSNLFGGGRALLKMTDPDNIQETGVEIEAQPPGKKLKNMIQLSTGEKTLTSIALLFALFNYKPAPFYFLDEIESALDGHNLTRFISYLKKAARKSQFILITHRRFTMEESAFIYGVTMPEKGVSKVLSVKVEDINTG